MNIFVTDKDPAQSARNLCNKHVVKMMLETMQILCSPFANGKAPYRQTHFHHPCSVWARESLENYEWLILHAIYIGNEYTARYGKKHKSAGHISWIIDNYKDLKLPIKGLTPFVQAMPDYCKSGNAVDAYRNYYVNEKRSFAAWPKGKAPDWYAYGIRALKLVSDKENARKYVSFFGEHCQVKYENTIQEGSVLSGTL